MLCPAAPGGLLRGRGGRIAPPRNEERMEAYMMVSKDDTKARRGFCALLLAGLGILAVGKGTDTLALKDGLLAALVLLACGLAVQRLPKRARAFVLLAAVPVLAQCLQAVSTDIGVFLYFKLVPKLWALVLWLVLFCLLWGLLGRPGLAGGVCVTTSGLLALLNLALLQFRGTALQWQDIGSWRAALNVAGGYRLALSPKIVVLAVLWLWTLAALHWAGGLCAGAPRSAGFRAALGLGAAAAGVLLWVSPLIPASGVTSSYISTQNAFVANLFLQSRDLPLKKPKNYEAQLQQLGQYSSDAGTKVAETPDIVVIMNESFADLRCYGAQIAPEIYRDWDEILARSAHGTAYSSVFGGNTPNAEYEFLTGDSLLFYTGTPIPYETAVRQDVPALPGLLAQLGSGTVAMHPNEGIVWSREQVYPKLGFGRSVFLADYENTEMLRRYVSDQANYSQVLRVLEEADGPQFLFNVTIQNHGSYEEEDFADLNALLDSRTSCSQTRQYLTLVKESGAALKEFLQQLEQRPRKTYVVFFGDHQPWVDEAFYSQYESGQDAQEHLRYQVPYFIWCNQSQEEQQLPLCGLNDLQLYLAGQAGLPLTGYQKLLAQVAQRYPVVCAQGVRATDGSWLDEKQIAEDDLLNLYRTAVYAHMNEPERLENFWTYAAG